MTIVAIDPGKGGGIATHFVSRHGDNETAVQPMPGTVIDVAKSLEPILSADTVVYMEHVPPYVPCARAKNMFRIGESFGVLQGILAAYKLRTVLVRPAKWQAYFGLGTRSACNSDSEWKNKLKAEAQRRFPQLKVTLKTADAILLLDYAIHLERNQK